MEIIRNYLLLAWRSLSRHRFFALLNSAGLSMGLLFCLLIGAYIWSELQVNRQLRNANRQYILTSEWRDPNIGYPLTSIGPLAKQLKEKYPTVVSGYYRFDGITTIVSKGEKYFREGIQIGDSTMLQLYGFDLEAGDSRTALNEPNSIVITVEKARLFFGKESAVGQTLTLQSFSGSTKDFRVTGVLKEPGDNSVTHLNGDNQNHFFVPQSEISFFGRSDMESWNNLYVVSYIELQEGRTAADLKEPIRQLLKTNASPAVVQDLQVKPLSLFRFYREKENGYVNRMMNVLLLTGLFVLLMAMVNFINLSISRSSSRMREIGVRKVLGGARSQLIVQFLAESILLVFLSALLALAAYTLVKPLFEQFTGKQLPQLNDLPIQSFIAIPLLVLVLGILAGIYPAFVLSALKAAQAVKGIQSSISDRILLRKALVGVQFSLALLLLTATVVVSRQIRYFFGGSLGYNKEYVIAAQVPRDWSDAGVRHMEGLRDRLARHPDVESVSLGYEIPNGNNGGTAQLFPQSADSTKAVSSQVMMTDPYFPETYQVGMAAGRYFNAGQKDTLQLAINATAAKALGWSEARAAVGQPVRIAGDPRIFTVKAVVSDYHFGSMQDRIPPMVYLQVQLTKTYRFFSIRLKPGSINRSLANVEAEWRKLMPGAPFNYKFQDDTLRTLYDTELRMQKAAYLGAGLAITMVLLGLLGLVTITLNRRMKEFGIRKVLGASFYGMLLLVLREFLFVLLPAALLALPLGYWIMHQWLQQYAYRTAIGATPFLIATGTVLLVTLLLVFFRSLHVLRSNPVHTLRSE